MLDELKFKRLPATYGSEEVGLESFSLALSPLNPGWVMRGIMVLVISNSF